jgi:hypothetical protein
MTLIHKRMAYYVVTVDGRSQFWKIDNGPGIAKYCRDVLAHEGHPDNWKAYRRATSQEHDVIAAAIMAVRPNATVTP